ncbi:gamma-glutamyltransferase family protein [Arthrobacter mobilis]|uniref:Gamma-glutamyltranspeptidase n=1 Tax=Arthrobacter mobilis TaxID=2724944 RepID=A0A7X6HF13_9MICC|nr:gamma-glutamyltransferase [Arthrobacter mobilis]NKX54482.1 gamma-glutamyltranspeptidase [Arthrobacter mobilis]
MSPTSASPSGATGGAVSTSHYLATEAGAQALRMGGNAIDAAVAAAAVLCVVYPNNVALGGDLVAIVRDPSGEVRFVNATGRAAGGERLEALRLRHGDALPDRGIDTVTVPGGVRGWAALAGLGARLGWQELLSPALRFARDGAPLARSMARAIHLERAALSADPGCRDVFLPGGTPLAEGELLRQPALAGTFERLIAHGPDEFYTGEVAGRWIAGLQALGSRISAEDVAGYAPTVERPIAGKAFGLEVLTSPPNTQGFSLLRTLRALETEHLADPLGADAGRLAGIFAENNRVRARWLADPDTAPIDVEGLVSLSAAAEAENDARVASGDTVGLVAASEDGWSVSLVQSVYWAFGAAVLEPSTGILFQNRGTSFSLDPAHPAAFAPGRRPPHTLMPVLVLRDGQLAYALATMGGQAQPQIHAHLLLRLLGGASAIEATSAARWAVGAQDDGDTPATLTVEADVSAAALRSLENHSRELKVVPPRDERLGHSNVIRVLESGFDAASDPRSDGSAIVVEAEQNEVRTS